MAHIWTSLLLFRKMVRPATTDLFCFGAKSTGVDLYWQTKFYIQASRSCQLLLFRRKRELTCFYVHFFDMKTMKIEIKKKLGQPGFEPTVLVFGGILTNHTTTVERTTSLSYQRIWSRLYQDVYFRNFSKHTDCTRSITKNYIFSVHTVIIYSCIKVRIRLIL